MILKRIIIFSLFLITLIGCELVEDPPPIIIDFEFDATQDPPGATWGNVEIDYKMINTGEIDLIDCALEFVVDCTPDVTYLQWTDKQDLNVGQSYKNTISVYTFGKEMIDVYVNAVGMDRPVEEETEE